jgi:hypothetical protein
VIDPVNELRASLDVLSRAEIEQAWSAADAVNKALGGNVAQRAEVAARLLAVILHELGGTTKRQDHLSDILPAVDALSTYVIGRMVTIVSDLGKADAA